MLFFFHFNDIIYRIMAKEIKYEWDKTISTPMVRSLDDDLVLDGTPGNIVLKGNLDLSEATLVGGDSIGNVLGPEVSTNNAVVRFDGITGKKIKNSNVTVSDVGSLNLPNGGDFRINGSLILNETTLGPSVVNSSLKTLGTLENLRVDNIYIDDDVIIINNGVTIFSISGNKISNKLDINNMVENLVSITNTGLIRGRYFHNSLDTPSGPGFPEIRSGTYTPSINNVSSTDNIVSSVAQWMRVGNVVTVSGYFQMETSDDINSTPTVSLSLPIATSLTDNNGSECSGTATGISTNLMLKIPGQVRSRSSDNTALILFKNLADAIFDVNYIFTYLIK